MKTALIIAFMLLAAQPQQVITARRRVVSTGGACSDNFTRANGPLGSNWTQNSGGTIQIDTNAANPEAFNPVSLAWMSSCALSGTTSYAQVTLGTISNAEGPALNVTDFNNYYALECTSGGGCSLVNFTGGTFNFIGSPVYAPTTGDVVCLEITSGATLKLKVNGSYVSGATFSAPASAPPAGYGGMYFAGGGATPSTITAFSSGRTVCP